ncbi:MAG: hypothetical protein OXF11_08110 [Deltaproteobacteria bacterium]|nr:hypothetical protein [Deltaproteobacteria bacterium]
METVPTGSLKTRFLQAIEVWCARSGTSAGALGVAALRDRDFVASLRRGRNPRLGTVDSVAPSECFAVNRGRRHKQLTDWARQGMLQILRWLPQRAIVFVGDSSFGTHELAWRIGRRAM